MAYQGIRRGGARYYTLEREALLRRASFTMMGSVVLFLGAIGLLMYERQQLTPADPEVVGPEAVLESAPDAPMVATLPPSVEQFPPTITPTPTIDASIPTATPTPVICRGVVEGTSGNGLTLREVPGGTEISILPDGTIVTLLEEAPQEANGFVWRKIRLIGGDEGWVAQDFVTTRAPCN